MTRWAWSERLEYSPGAKREPVPKRPPSAHKLVPLLIEASSTQDLPRADPLAGGPRRTQCRGHLVAFNAVMTPAQSSGRTAVLGTRERDGPAAAETVGRVRAAHFRTTSTIWQCDGRIPMTIISVPAGSLPRLGAGYRYVNETTCQKHKELQ